jgi:hypothetical protein
MLTDKINKVIGHRLPAGSAKLKKKKSVLSCNNVNKRNVFS